MNNSKQILLDIVDEQKKTIEKYSNKLRGNIIIFGCLLFLLCLLILYYFKSIFMFKSKTHVLKF